MKMNYVISEGPSKFDLMVSLFDGKIVEFTQQNQVHVRKIKVRVISIQTEDGSHSSWNIMIYIVKSDVPTFEDGKTYSAYYNSKTRKGTISTS